MAGKREGLDGDRSSLFYEAIRIVKENIVIALLVKLIVLILGSLGLASMWAAVFADVGVSVLAILNSMRCGRLKS